MSHDEAIETRIPFYVNGTLPAAEREELDRHLRECGQCRELVAEASVLRAGALAGADRLMDHPHAQHLDDFARSPERTSAGMAAWIRAHLDACPPCREAHKVLRDLAAERPGPVADAASLTMKIWGILRGTLLHPIPAIAYFVVAAISLTLYMRPPAPGTTPAGGGAIDLPVVTSVLRGSPARPIARPTAGSPLAALGVEFALPDRIDRSSQVVFSIRDGSNRTVWTDRMSLERVERALSTTGVIVLLVPVEAIGPGRYGLIVELSDGGPAGPLMEGEFEVAIDPR